jgi:hypothetical protein
VWPVLHSCLSLFWCLFIVQGDFCLGILLANVLCISQSNPLHCTSLLFPPVLCCSAFFSVFCSYTDMIYFTIIHNLSFFSSCLSLLYQSHLPVLYIFTCIYDTACICNGNIFHIWDRAWGFWLSEPR